MKKWILALLTAILCAAALTGCGRNPAATAEIDLGTSSVYSEDDRNAAVRLILHQFSTWNGCELHRVSYGGDAECNEENLAWLNSLGGETEYTQAAQFLMDFHTAPDIAGAWEPDHEYEDYQWWLARTEEGGWQLLSWGY